MEQLNINTILNRVDNEKQLQDILNKFEFKIDDALSGFEPAESSFDLILDQKPLIYAYQPKSKIISYQLGRPLALGTHTLQLSIRDRAGNKINKKIEFKVY